MKETLQGTALLVAVTHGFLAWSLAGANPSWAQDKEALDICLNREREPGVRVEACRTAAEQGLASAQFSLGNIYRTGEGVPQDYGEAVKWFRLAADQGNACGAVQHSSNMCLAPARREPGKYDGRSSATVVPAGGRPGRRLGAAPPRRHVSNGSGRTTGRR